MKSKNLTLFMPYLIELELGKDVFLVPYYLGKSIGYNVKIVYLQVRGNEKLEREYRGVIMNPLKNFLSTFKLGFFIRLMYLILNAKNIDLLMAFHVSVKNAIICYIYKLINPMGEFYLKGDMKEVDIIYIQSTAPFWKRLFYKVLLKNADFISLETKSVYNYWKRNKICDIDVSKKIILVSNGFDEEKIKEMNFRVKKLDEKENIFITVGRLYSEEKNVNMILKAIEKINDIGDWRFYFIGPLSSNECDFSTEIEDFYKRNLHLKDRVIFMGSILDKKELWEYYNRAKVFVLTSKWESYGIVLNEAYRFNNYIISTDVGAARDIISKSNNFGELVEQENYEQLAEIIKKIINNRNCFNIEYDLDTSDHSWDNCLKELIEKIKKE